MRPESFFATQMVLRPIPARVEAWDPLATANGSVCVPPSSPFLVRRAAASLLLPPALRNQPEFLPNLHRLCSSFGVEFVKQAAGVRLHCVFTYEKFFGNFPIAHALGD